VNSGTLIISAHGVAPSVVQRAKEKKLNVVDSTCPLVTVLHKAADFFIKRNYTVIVFGDPDHDEMKGVKGHNPRKIIVLEKIASLEDLPDIDGNVALISQSTQSVELFEKAVELVQQKYREVKIKNTICDATRKHQTAVIDLASRTDLVIVVGSQTSANSRRLAQTSKRLGTPAHLIDDYSEIDPEWLKGVRNVGITAGASTPDWAIVRVVDRIRELALSDGNAEVNVFDEKSKEAVRNEK
jgi:4-hydroxy-3-methylbut-2-enyl diphosphate reductase